MTYEQALEIKENLENAVKEAKLVVNSFPKTAMNLTTDEAKVTEEYKIAKTKLDVAFNQLRKFNASFTKTFKKEIKASKKF